MVYSWLWNMPVGAQVAGEFLEKLEDENGRLTPEIVLDASREKDAPLHPCFEWNDSVAAEKYRKSQATDILCNLVVTIEQPDTPKKTVRAFVNVTPQERRGSFIGIVAAMKDDTCKRRILASARDELLSFQRKYDDLIELSGVFDAIRAFAAAV